MQRILGLSRTMAAPHSSVDGDKLVDCMLTAVLSSLGSPGVAENCTSSNGAARGRAFNRARDLIESDQGYAIGMQALCEYTGLSERSLRRARGCTPDPALRKNRR